MRDSTDDTQYPALRPYPSRPPLRQRLGKCLNGCAWLAVPLTVTSLVLGAFLFMPVG